VERVGGMCMGKEVVGGGGKGGWSEEWGEEEGGKGVRGWEEAELGKERESGWGGGGRRKGEKEKGGRAAQVNNALPGQICVRRFQAHRRHQHRVGYSVLV